jgi:hypothetical protein
VLDPKQFPEPLVDISKLGDKLSEKDIFLINTLEVARQLTLIDFEMLSKISKEECMLQIWGAKLFDVTNQTPFTSDMIQMTTKVKQLATIFWRILED